MTEFVQLPFVEAVKLYGKPRSISDELAIEIYRSELRNRLACIKSDEGWHEDWIEPGYGLVNVLERVFFPKPLPPNIQIVDIDWNLIEQEDVYAKFFDQLLEEKDSHMAD